MQSERERESEWDSLLRIVSIAGPRQFIPAETDPIIRYAPKRGLPTERATAFIASNLRPRDTASTYLPFGGGDGDGVTVMTVTVLVVVVIVVLAAVLVVLMLVAVVGGAGSGGGSSGGGGGVYRTMLPYGTSAISLSCSLALSPFSIRART